MAVEAGAVAPGAAAPGAVGTPPGVRPGVPVGFAGAAVGTPGDGVALAALGVALWVALGAAGCGIG